MAASFQKFEAKARAEASSGQEDQTGALRQLDARQRRVLSLFEQSAEITAKEIGELFGREPRAASALCQSWIQAGFLVVSRPSKKSRRYWLAGQYEAVIVGRTF